MKRSEMIELMLKEWESFNCECHCHNEEEMMSSVLSAIEEAGMLPPKRMVDIKVADGGSGWTYTRVSTHDSLKSKEAFGSWEPEDEEK
jgi:hypothetical protein